jgi:hypothetical protein
LAYQRVKRMGGEERTESHLHSGGVIFGEGKVSDGHILEKQVEITGSLGEHVSDLSRHVLTTSQQLGGIEASDHRLGHLVDDGGKHTLVEVCKGSPSEGGGNTDHGRVCGR